MDVAGRTLGYRAVGTGRRSGPEGVGRSGMAIAVHTTIPDPRHQRSVIRRASGHRWHMGRLAGPARHHAMRNGRGPVTIRPQRERDRGHWGRWRHRPPSHRWRRRRQEPNRTPDRHGSRAPDPYLRWLPPKHESAGKRRGTGHWLGVWDFNLGKCRTRRKDKRHCAEQHAFCHRTPRVAVSNA